MNTLRMNITLPIELGRWLKSTKNASGFIAELLREKRQYEEKKKQIKVLEEAYKATAAEDARLAADWQSVSGDGL